MSILPNPDYSTPEIVSVSAAPPVLQLVPGPLLSPPPERPFGLVTLAEASQCPARDWLVDGLWPEEAVGFIGGPPKAGKSWLALDLSLCIATGERFLGREVRRGKVLYFLGEDCLPDQVVRGDRLLRGHGLSIAKVKEGLFLAERIPCLEEEKDRAALVAAVRDMHPDLVVFDPLERFLGQGDGNSSKDMRVVNNFFRQELARGCGTSVCVVHHTDKKAKGLRGTGDFRAVSEVTLLFSEPAQGSVLVTTEMRGSRPPEPFRLTLLDLPDGSARWIRSDETSPQATGKPDREAEAKDFLLQAGSEGVTLEAAQKHLKMRAAAVKPLLESIGARPEGPRGRWVLPPCATAATVPDAGPEG